jgi:hypothetical protein
MPEVVGVCLVFAVSESGAIPPGNAPGETKWQARTVRVKPEIKLTAGKAISVPIEDLIDQVVKTNKVRKAVWLNSTDLQLIDTSWLS